jgi:glycosyltransferase involved in cell wall biosynthesis
MIDGRRVAVVMPAYNAEQTLRTVLDSMPPGLADEIILVDDASHDRTTEIAAELGLRVLTHRRNLGYGGNQKTCYAAALATGVDIVVMLHPDYQYSPRLLGAMTWMIASGEYDVVLGSRILGNSARRGGMPAYKYFSNRALTALQNVLLGCKLSEFHTGYRAYSREALESLPLGENSDDFVFDNQLLAQAVRFGMRVGEISCPTRYFPEASSINFHRSVVYGLGVVATSIAYRLDVWGIWRNRIFSPDGTRITSERASDERFVSEPTPSPSRQ